MCKKDTASITDQKANISNVVRVEEASTCTVHSCEKRSRKREPNRKEVIYRRHTGVHFWAMTQGMEALGCGLSKALVFAPLAHVFCARAAFDLVDVSESREELS